MSRPAVECKDVWKIFGRRVDEALAAIRNEGLGKATVLERFGCVVAVAGASFAVKPGEIFCIMGLSGSGKSTLVRHINRLVEPTAGQILVAGEEISRKSESKLRRLRAERIGMVFQNMALLPHRTVRENVALSLELRKVDKATRLALAEEKLALVQLGGWGDRYPNELSGGMQQRVGLARALAADPDILLMDEPFSALDPLIRRELQDEFIELAATMNKTTVFITHDLDEAIRLGHHVGIMKDGRIVQIGTPEEVVTNPADAYVAKFVQGISRLKLVRAARAMIPIGQYCRTPEHPSFADAPRAGPEADLDQLIELSNGAGNRPIVVVDGSGREVGVVTTATLLRSIQGRAVEGSDWRKSGSFAYQQKCIFPALN
jgi:glycine betaine/proline transport system ATP-binding protein